MYVPVYFVLCVVLFLFVIRCVFVFDDLHGDITTLCICV